MHLKLFLSQLIRLSWRNELLKSDKLCKNEIAVNGAENDFFILLTKSRIGRDDVSGNIIRIEISKKDENRPL